MTMPVMVLIDSTVLPCCGQQAALARVTLVGDIVDVDDDDELIQLK